MFGIGFWEIIVVLLVALIVIKPKEFPKIAEAIGLKIGQIKRYIEVMQHDRPFE